MRTPNWTPSIIVPNVHDQNVYLVVEDFGRNGSAYVETDIERTDLESVIGNLLDGQHSNPIQVVAFNIAEGWSQDASEDVAQELRRRCDLQFVDPPSTIQDFIERHEGRTRQLTL